MFGNFFQSLGNGLKQGFGNLKRLGEDGTDARTPPFLPEGGGVKPQLPVSQPQIPARPNPPLSVSPFVTEGAAPYSVKPPMAPPRELPSAEEIAPRAGGMGIIPRPALPPAAMPQGQPGNTAEALDRRGVPLPALPGQRNPTPYSDINRERYDYNTAHMKRDENGDLTSKYKRDWKQVLGNMLMGAAQGAQSVGPHGNALGGLIGGAGAAAGGSIASPQGSTNYAFDTRRLPEIERQQAEAEHERALDAARVKAEQDAMMGRAKLGQVLAGTEHTQAQTDALRNPADQYGAAGWGTYNKRTGEVGYEKPAGTATPYRPQGLINTRDGIFDPATRQWVEKFDTEKPQSPADRRADEQQRKAALKDSQAFMMKFGDLKNKLIKTEAQLSNPEVQRDPALYKSFESQAAAMKAQLADLAQFGNDNYGDTLEGGPGQSGYAYIKPRTGGPAPARPAGAKPAASAQGSGRVFPASRVEAFAQSKGMSREQTLQYLQKNGYEVR